MSFKKVKIKMIPNKYAYFAGCMLFFIPWAILFWHRKDLRKAMLVTGAIGAVGSLLTAYFWTADWWRPETITGTRIGVEDIVLGFSNVGIATVLYVEVFHKRLYHRRKTDHSHAMLPLSLLACLIFWISFSMLQFNSFFSCIIGLSVYGLIMVILREDLLLGALLNGLLMVLVAMPVYFIMVLLSPHIIQHTYTFPLAVNIRIFDVPVQEFVFYFVFGATAAILYEYWQGLRLRNFAAKKPPVSTRKKSA